MLLKKTSEGRRLNYLNKLKFFLNLEKNRHLSLEIFQVVFQLQEIYKLISTILSNKLKGNRNFYIRLNIRFRVWRGKFKEPKETNLMMN
jgi:tRNA(Ser,Leu) C12 N-acetylase TAN1